MDTELFNDKTIKRLCSNVKISQKQKKNANEWISLLESGSLEKERTNYFKFALYVLRDILGYSVKEDLDYEKSNIEFTFKDSIGKTILCIEVKGESKDLFGKQTGYRTEQSTPFKQTWDNMGRIDSIKYGICTNYKDFILIDKSKGYSKYHFFDFLEIKKDSDKLKEFIAIFSKENIIDKEFIETLYEKSIIEEREFTKQFYKLFHETRLMLIKEFQDNGPSRDESIHFAQIFLNRLMFVFFAEDTGKLKQRLFEDMVLNLLKVDSVFSEKSHMVCNLVKSIFENLNEGSKRHNIFGFNGGLFKEQIPEKIYFRDFIKKMYFNEIYQHSTLKKEIELDEHSKSIIDIYEGSINPITLNLLYMASFDFNTEVSVNILGHIFEQSISDLEELREEKVLRRKKEGVYYTPDFITDYICRNTIIPYLSKRGVNTVETLIDEYSDNIDDLEKKFKNLKILDPACGSGSFLLKAVEVLLEIHKQIQIVKQIEGQYTAKKVAGLSRKQKRALRDNLQLSFTKWHEEDEAREIIENNIFGVDINEESVEITKLSLFLKIVKKNKKLIDLSKNIKCGNALIAVSEVPGERVFNWNNEFKAIMDNGGFDLIIGNPPYVRADSPGNLPEFRDTLKRSGKFQTLSGKWDMYIPFIELSIILLNEDGYSSLIIPDAFCHANYATSTLNWLRNNRYLSQISYFPKIEIFEGVGINNIVIHCTKKPSSLFNQRVFINKTEYVDKKFKNLPQHLRLDAKESIIKNITDYHYLNDICYISKGIVGNSDEKKYKGEFKIGDLLSDLKDDLHTKEYIEGKDIEKWHILNKRWIEYRTNRSPRKWSRKVFPEFFNMGEKLITMRSPGLEPKTVFTQDEIFFNESAIGFKRWNELIDVDNKSLRKSYKTIDNRKKLEEISKNFSLKYIALLMNSSLIRYELNTNRRSNIHIYPDDWKQIKIRSIPYNKQDFFIEKADMMLKLKNDFFNKKRKFLNRVKHNLNLNKITKKLDNFFKFDYYNFVKELSKQKISLNLHQQDEWEDYFNEYKGELTKLQKQINQTDEEINKLVNKLYGLTKEEISIIEESIK